MEKKKTRVVVLRALERIAESLNKLRELQVKIQIFSFYFDFAPNFLHY